MQPETVVQRQLEAYNDRDLVRFVAEYSEAIQVFRPPATLPAIRGKTALTEFYRTQRFDLVDLRAEVLSRIVLGCVVIDHERITGVRKEPFEVAVAYEVVNGLIQSTWTFAAE